MFFYGSDVEDCMHHGGVGSQVSLSAQQGTALCNEDLLIQPPTWLSVPYGGTMQRAVSRIRGITRSGTVVLPHWLKHFQLLTAGLAWTRARPWFL